MPERSSLDIRAVKSMLSDTALGLDPKDFIVVMGASLVLHGIKGRTSDIDLSLPTLVFEKLMKHGAVRAHSRSGLRKILLGKGIAGYENWPVTDYVEIDGLRVATLESVRGDKSKLQRSKDYRDIRAIDLALERLEERSVSIHSNFGQLRGVIHNSRARTALLILHGHFSSNRIGPYRLYVDLARRLAKTGIGVARFDLSALGESDGDLKALRYEHHVTDVKRIIDWIQNTLPIENLSLLGHCSGCHLALEVGDAQLVRQIFLVAPFIPGKRGFANRVLSESEWQALQANGYTLRKGFYCHRSFIDSSEILSSPRMHQLAAKTLVLAAADDEFTCPSEVMEWSLRTGARTLVVESADHNFTESSARYSVAEIVRESLA